MLLRMVPQYLSYGVELQESSSRIEECFQIYIVGVSYEMQKTVAT